MNVGDTAHVKAVVQRVHTDGSAAVTINGGGWINVPASDVVTVEPKPLAVGDRVYGQDAEGGWIRTIIAIHGIMAWTYDDGIYSVELLTDLVRVPAEPEVVYKGTERPAPSPYTDWLVKPFY